MALEHIARNKDESLVEQLSELNTVQSKLKQKEVCIHAHAGIMWVDVGFLLRVMYMYLIHLSHVIAFLLHPDSLSLSLSLSRVHVGRGSGSAGPVGEGAAAHALP